LGFGLSSPFYFYFLSYFLTQLKLNPNSYLNSNLNLNSTLKLKQLKQMHQHECNTKI